MKRLLQRIHGRLGDFWWYSLLMFVALRCGDLINAVVGLWLVPKYVGQEELGAVLPLTQFASSVGAPLTVLVTVFSKYLTKFKTQGEEGKVKSMILWFVGLAVVLTVLTSAVAIAVLPHFFERIRIASGSLVVLIIASGIVTTVTPVFTNALQGLKKFHAITLINLLSAPVRLGVMLVAMPFRALSGYMLGQTAAPLFAIFTSCFALRKEVRKSVKAVPFWRGDGREIAKYSALVSAWTAVGAVCTPVTAMIVRQRLPEVESSAYYMISRFAELATYAGLTLSYVMVPLVAENATKGRNDLRTLFCTQAGTLVFGLIATAVLYFAGPTIFNLIPTCRPYVAYVPDMALMATMLTVSLTWSIYTFHEMARERFGFMCHGVPIVIGQTLFLACFTGYSFFYGILPDRVVAWMASLNMATITNYLWALLLFNALRLGCSYVCIFRQVRRGKSMT